MIPVICTALLSSKVLFLQAFDACLSCANMFTVAHRRILGRDIRGLSRGSTGSGLDHDNELVSVWTQ